MQGTKAFQQDRIPSDANYLRLRLLARQVAEEGPSKGPRSPDDQVASHRSPLPYCITSDGMLSRGIDKG